MSKLNADARKDVRVDILSDTEEIDVTFEEITNRRLALKKFVYTLP